MDKMIKDCFEPHVLMHALFGLGLGLLITALVPSLSSVLFGIILMVVSIVLDMMRNK